MELGCSHGVHSTGEGTKPPPLGARHPQMEMGFPALPLPEESVGRGRGSTKG